MGDRTAISWTRRTWNPWRGCTKVSPGCDHCYMFRDQERYGRDPAVVVRSKTTWGDPLRWQRDAAAVGLRDLVFTCSWSDFFHTESDEWRDEAWAVIRSTPNLVYQILTKRAAHIKSRLPADWGDGYRNVWLGVSVELPGAYWRVAALRDIPAAVRWLSVEPLLGAVPELPLGGIDWAVFGGESGPEARPMRPEWLADGVRQCDAAGVPVHVKQDSGPLPGQQGRIPDDLWRRKEMPAREALG